MSELDVREVRLQLRYPESRQEDITDAYMRGYKSVMQVTDKLITRLNEENEKLRELAKGLSWCSKERYLGHQESECPLYDERTDGKCRAEALMKELGIEAGA